MEQFCSSKGKYLTSIVQELLNITVESHVTFPVLVTMTFVLTAEFFDEATSALKQKIPII